MEMIRAFFQVSENEKARLPTPEECQDFMKNYLSLGKSVFEHFPEDMPEVPAPVHDYSIVDSLLTLEGAGSILANIEEKINSDFDAFQQAISDRKDWPEAIEKGKSEQEHEVLGAAGTPEAALRHKQVVNRRRKIYDQWLSNDGLRHALYMRLDDKIRGGLDYTITLIEQIKYSLDNRDTGVIKTLEDAQMRYLDLADRMLKERYLPFMDNLKETFGIDLLGSKKRHAEIIIRQVREALYFRLLYLMRAKACSEAASLVRDLSEWLGERTGLDDQGEAIGMGLVKEFLDGRRSVRETIALLNDEILRLEDSENRMDSVYLTLKDEKAEIKLNPSQAVEWAEDAFKEFGGSKELFEKLQFKEGRTEVLNKLRRIARERFTKLAGTNAAPSFLDAFVKLTSQERVNLLKKLLTRAMPWIDADLSGNFNSSFSPDQFKAYIAVKESGEFERQYGGLLDQVVPPGGLQRNYIQVVDSGIDGRMICYVELSGIPLDVIKPLRSEWRTDYLKQMGKGLPLHNHKDFTRFPHPIVPTLQDIKTMMQNIRLFLEGVGLGILRRRKGEEGLYEIEVDRGEWQSVGNERRVRSMGFGGDHRVVLKQKLQDAREKAKSPYQRLALEVLFNYYANKVYKPLLEKDNSGVETRVRGLASIQVAELSNNWKGKLERMDSQFDVEAMRKLLDENIAIWTSEITGTLGEIDPSEVDVEHAAPKLSVKKEFFNEGWLEQQFRVGTEMQPQIKSTGPECPSCRRPVQEGFKNCPYCGSALEGCPACGKPLQQGFRLCPYCGLSLENTCPKCGSKVESSWKFCPNCSAQIGSSKS